MTTLAQTPAATAQPAFKIDDIQQTIVAPPVGMDRGIWLATLKRWRDELKTEMKYDSSRFSQSEFTWTQRSYVQTQMMAEDRYLYDPIANKYTVDRYLDDLDARYGGVDSVLVWTAYPNIGIDNRNQHDLLADMPGGLPGVKAMVDDFHKRGVRVLFAIQPWDTVLANELIYCVARDVTDEKVARQKLQEYAVELERSNAELQQFAYVASHDLKEPLRAVAGCVQMLAERNQGKVDERSTELMVHAVDGAKRMQTLINDLLAYSRVGSKGINRTLIDVGPAIEKAKHQLQVSLIESDALITVDPLPRVFADPAQLTQLFQNLLSNAFKFGGDRRPEIHISAEQGEGYVTFSVRDNGIGIDPEYLTRIFGLFQRLHSRRDYSGTGIGLAICKKIIDRHGGRIWIESVAGQGANFRFTIPAETTS